MDASTAPFLVRHEFLIRRLHSLSGLIPVGAYLCVHLVTNASVLGGSQIFQDNVNLIHSLGPLLPLVEWTFIFLPLIFHAVVGVMIVRSGMPNTSSYPYANNVRYTLQRATAWIALFFILYHVFHMHGWFHVEPWMENVVKPLGGGQFEPENATNSAALALQPIVVRLLYAIGVLASVYHFANGIWTMGITWGVWVTPAAQKRADYICMAFGLLLSIVGLGALFGFSTVEVPEAAATAAPEANAQDADEPTLDEENASTAARLPASERQ
ncbi:MAG: succinate dehydrogenase cytochrome b558 subunit [Planctomycetia bacterium]|nr:succinate dehydrogenase cytochrome b558 subunit [Planctomycetia bacterium]